MTETDRDWRKSAYLRKENWPEAIPWTGPRRAYGPYSWGKADIDGCKYPQTIPTPQVSDTTTSVMCARGAVFRSMAQMKKWCYTTDQKEH
jgi:hypothetical protein